MNVSWSLLSSTRMSPFVAPMAKPVGCIHCHSGYSGRGPSSQGIIGMKSGSCPRCKICCGAEPLSTAHPAPNPRQTPPRHASAGGAVFCRPSLMTVSYVAR